MLFQKETLKQYGLPRSGTNYIKWFIENNYLAKVNVNKGGWKHGFHVNSNKRSFSTVKNPYSWCVSVHAFITKNFEQKTWCPFETELGEGSSIENFLLKKFIIKSDQESHEFENPIHYWNLIIKNWIKFDIPILRYEDLLINPHKSISCLKLKRVADLELKYVVCPGMEQTIINRTCQFDFKYYSKKDYMNKINKRCIEITRYHVDKNTLRQLNYEIH
jgi:hypothetical protein